MENKDISQIALQKIKESGIKPISKNIFNFKRVLFWSLVGFSIIIGIVSFSITLSLLFNNDWYLYNKFGAGFILKSLPYFWVVCLLIFTILGEFYYRKTFLGYRHRMTTVIGVYVILTLIFGTILYLFGIGETTEQSLFENIPVYRVVTFDKNEFWSHPEEGLIFGKIILVDGALIKIKDKNNNIWDVNIKDAIVNGIIHIKKDETVMVSGDVDDGGVINAKQIKPWIRTKVK